ncbi:MAG: glutaredoxin domain-containing protein [Verrucomicrobiota bacterium]
MLTWITSRKEFEQAKLEYHEYMVLAFWGDFSANTGRALNELQAFSEDYREIPLFVVDVQKLKGLHKEYGVTSVPTVLVLKKGTEFNRYEGVESAAFYAVKLGGSAPASMARPAKKKKLRVTVYTSPGCAPCNLVKNYLREHNIQFTVIDISQDANAAREIVRRSGQQAVPQTDINGQIVVGFNKSEFAARLGVQD